MLHTALLLGTLTLAFASRRRRRVRKSIDRSATPSGLSLRAGMLSVDDLNAFFAHVATVATPVLRNRGASGRDVMLALVRDAFPDRQWPPPSETGAGVQWEQLAGIVDELLARKPNPTPPRLRVVS
jgi:hypothetical protein